MSTQQPTTAEVSANITAQLESSLNQTLSSLPRAFNRVLAKALAGVFILLYKYIGFGILQYFVAHASTSKTVVNGRTIIPLVVWGEQIGVGVPAAATAAQLLVDVTVENQTGSLDTGAQLVNATNGVTYLTTGSVLLNAPVVQVTVQAVSDQNGGNGAGAIGNLNSGDTISFANPLPNVARNAVVDSQVVTGADGESWDAYRQRVADRFQKRPQGGALSDYELWGEEPAGIVNIYPYRSDCPGQVDVYVEATPASSGDPDGIPTPAQLQEVLDSIILDDSGLASRRPVGALVNTFGITRLAFDVTITNLAVDDTATVQADVQSALEGYFLERAPFIVGLSVNPRLDNVTAASVSATAEAIVSAAGGTFDVAGVTQSGTPVAIYTLGIGQKAKLGTLTFS